MIPPQLLQYVQCSACGKEAQPELYNKKIIIKQLYFCSQRCLDLCCSVVKTQAGVFIIGSSFIVSLWLGPIMIPFMLAGMIILLCGLVGSKNCVFAKQITKNKPEKTIIEEVDASKFGRI